MYKYLIICLFVTGCSFDDSREDIEYFADGKVKKIIKRLDEEEVIVSFDTLGQKISEEFLKASSVTKYIDYYYFKKYNMEEYGEVVDGEKEKYFNKYFSKETDSLKRKISFIKLINNENCKDETSGDSCFTYYYDNQAWEYTDTLTIIDEQSCYFSIKPKNEILVKDSSYELMIEAKCYDFNKMIIIFGEYGQYFNKQGAKFDTLRSESNTISLKFTPVKFGEMVFLGKIFMYKEIVEDGEELWEGKSMYFRKKFTVNP